MDTAQVWRQPVALEDRDERFSRGSKPWRHDIAVVACCRGDALSDPLPPVADVRDDRAAGGVQYLLPSARVQIHTHGADDLESSTGVAPAAERPIHASPVKGITNFFCPNSFEIL